MADLPKDTLYDIFSRLPIKSLARFRCVCKTWCNYIDDPYLVSIHVNEPILMMLNGQCAILPKQLGLGIVSIIEPKEGNTVLEVKQDPIYRFESKGRTILDIGVCNGMILFHPRYSSSYLVIHPLRKECYELPFVDLQYHPSYVNAYGLGFDNSTKIFKVVFLFNSRPTSLTDWGSSCTMVHVLGTYSWRKIPQIPDDCSMMKGQGVFVKGLLYWAINHCWPGTHGDIVIHKVIYFDVTKEEFGSIDPPPRPTMATRQRLVINEDELLNIHDKVGYAYKIDDSVLVWILKHKEWVSYCQFHCAPPLNSGDCFLSLRGLQCCNQDGDILIRERIYGGLFIYKRKSGDLHELNISGLQDKSEIILYQSHLSSTIHDINKMRFPATKIDLIKATSTRTFFKAFYTLKSLFALPTFYAFSFVFIPIAFPLLQLCI